MVQPVLDSVNQSLCYLARCTLNLHRFLQSAMVSVRIGFFDSLLLHSSFFLIDSLLVRCLVFLISSITFGLVVFINHTIRNKAHARLTRSML